MQSSIVTNDDGTGNVTVLVDGEVHVAHSDHPSYAAILEGVIAGDDEIIELFDIAQTIEKRFEGLTERVSVKNGKIYLDGDEVNNSLTKLILRFLDEGKDWAPLVLFFEKLQSNPSGNSREQLYRFLSTEGFSLTDEGDIIAYKGVRNRSEDDEYPYESLSSGEAIVDGVEYSGCIPNRIGAVVEMPRSAVADDPDASCSVGLHVSTYAFAQSYSRQGTTLSVLVNPRDVVSVPNHEDEKVRVCRYKVYDQGIVSSYDTACVKLGQE